MSVEEDADSLADLRNEVLRRVGRNLLLYQQIELIMKFLVANANIEVSPSGPSPQELRHRKKIQGKGLGQIQEQFFNEFVASPVEALKEPQLDGLLPTICIRSSFQLSPEQAEQLARDQERFEAMTDERNDLVHHFLEHCQLSSKELLEGALIDLNAQRERALPLHDNLVRLHDALVAGRKAIVEFIQSPTFSSVIELAHLQSSRIVTLLAQATLQRARSDGWTLLSKAGNFIAAEDPEQLPSIKRRFGHRGLRSLVAASELFELKEELCVNENKRTIYRLKPGAFEIV